jgi:putative MATE family efflux protein
MEGQNMLTEGNPFSTLLKFAMPFLMSSFLQALYGATDLLVVGHFFNSAGVSAVAIGSQVMQTITGIILGITTGGTILIGQYLGAKKQKDVAETIGSVICMFGVISIVLTFGMALLSGTLTNIMDTPVEAITYTRQYIFICSCGIPFIVGYNAISGILRGLGDSKTPVIFIAIACAVNLIANLILVGIFHMGAAGSAISTIFAQAVSLILGVLFLYNRGFSFEFNRSYIKFNSFKVRNIFKLGLPIAMQDGLVNISFLLITAIINTMGLTASAAVGVVEKIIVFTMLPTCAFAAAIATITAQNIGAGKQDRAKKSLCYGIGCSLIFGIIFCIYSQINPESLAVIFSKDRAVLKTASEYLRSYSIDCIMVCFVFCMNSFFSGCGHSMFSMAHSLIATFGVRIPVCFYLSRLANVTLYQMGFAAPLASLVSIALCLYYIRSGRWKVNKIIGAVDNVC